MTTTTQFVRDVALTAIALGYKNPDIALIADLVMPRTGVDKKIFSYVVYPEAEMFDIPDTRVGELSQMQSGTVGGTEQQSKCDDEGHQISLSADDISQSKANQKPKDRAAMKATNVVVLAREKRVATINQATSSYDATLTKDLDGTVGKKKWSDKVDGTPLDDMLTALDACLVRPNLLTLSQPGWSALRRHPQLVKAIGSTTGEGAITRQQLADLLEIQEVLVGAAWANTAKEGLPASLSRLWGPHASLTFRDRTVDQAGGVTWGYTAEFEKRQAGWSKVDIGVRGGEAVRVWETVKELVIAKKAGFLFSNIL